MPFLAESVFGLTTSNTAQWLREYLTVLRAIRDDRTVDFHGSQPTAVDPSVLPVALAGATPFLLYVAAMGPRALQVTGELADGTLLANAGPRTIDDVDAARASAATSLALYDSIPSYQKVFAREGVSSAVDLAVIGPAER